MLQRPQTLNLRCSTSANRPLFERNPPRNRRENNTLELAATLCRSNGPFIDMKLGANQLGNE